MRISFDLDGVLADMDAGLARAADTEFGDPAPPVSSLNAKQQTRLWDRVAATRNFWEGLGEHEKGAVKRVQALAHRHHWDVLFVTQRPTTQGRTPQVQTQRWLKKHGFEWPAVYTTKGGRGRIAAALDLDVHLDDRLENAVDIATDSRACSILVWRDAATFDRMVINGKKMKIAVVRTVGEALDQIEAVELAQSAAADAEAESPGKTARATMANTLRQAFLGKAKNGG